MSRRRKLESVGAETTSSDSPFQIRGPETLKARLPTVDSRNSGTTRRLELAERIVPADRADLRLGRAVQGTVARCHAGPCTSVRRSCIGYARVLEVTYKLHTIRYARYGTICDQKLTSGQLSLPHITKTTF